MKFSVSAGKEEALKSKMSSLGIKESDLRELFILSSKKGGQKVNKTSACVYLKHIPTGIEVKCQQERSLHDHASARRGPWRSSAFGISTVQ